MDLVCTAMKAWSCTISGCHCGIKLITDSIRQPNSKHRRNTARSGTADSAAWPYDQWTQVHAQQATNGCSFRFSPKESITNSRHQAFALPSSTLFIWDFDNTIILDNSDTLVFQTLAPDILTSIRITLRNSSPPYPWLELISTGLSTLHARGVSADAIRAAAASAHLPDATAGALRAIAREAHAKSLVLSDANGEFIGATLEKHGLGEVFEGGVFTNCAYEDDDGRIVLKPYVPEGKEHGCGRCGRNLCKGEVVDELRGKYEGWRMVYVGDGGNDYCPVLRLGEEDAVLVRGGMALHRKIREGKPRASVLVWESAEELARFVDEFL